MSQAAHVQRANAFQTETRKRRDPDDVKELKWYFASGGLGVFSSSTFGAQLERAALFAFGGYECKRCRGTGCVASSRKKRRANERQAEMLRLVGIDPNKLLPPALDRICGKCDGMGWVPRLRRTNNRGPLTAQMTGSSKRGGGGGVDVGAVNLARLGAVQRRLDKVCEDGAMLRDALEAYYSPDGGAMTSLYPMTPAGKRLLRKNPLGLPARQLIENEVKAQKDKPEGNRGALLASAESQSTELLNAAIDAWNGAHRVRKPDVSERAARLLDGGAL